MYYITKQATTKEGKKGLEIITFFKEPLEAIQFLEKLVKSDSKGKYYILKETALLNL